MFKVTPNPPDSDPTSPYEAIDSKKLHEAADRALDHYLKPPTPDISRKPSSLFHVDPGADNETLLVHASESLASASVMLSDFAGLLDAPYRNTLLGIQQVVMLGEMTVNRALDNLDPPA
ncbi:hypothetical protein SAMN04490189_5408 [Pseudomonas koreensis]|uniref:DUF6124 family protein n=1 Tax=Pseudomonas koreensis TaxID=198620 RepID=UPI0008793B83|nr:DUF6124 family protein [Pseudomonas koreensis]KAB0513710.1 hypothetical protein F7R05_11320 [Pseudomonas koreensis]MCM8743950.1 DUF6124 family protein [Pseudomonas koreensis]NNA63518.1 hypothetical protein [Pseudomonas koreensis]SDE44374.1 hypothetical protein SAMN04490189_5408 [Pseudomonas koreensis]GGK35642.1 hypothetical protein GCM10009103_33370 [Pseudomonas koreensis]